MGRNFFQPDGQQEIAIQQDRQGKEEKQEVGIFRTIEQKFFEMGPVAGRIRLYDLRVEGGLEIGDKAVHGLAYLVGYPHRGVDRHAEEDIQDDPKALLRPDIRHTAEQAPSGETHQFLIEGRIPKEPVTADRETAVANGFVQIQHQQGHHRHQQGIKYQAVEPVQKQRENHQQAEHHFQYADVRIERHTLVSDDAGIVWYPDYLDAGSQHGELVTPYRRSLPAGRDFDVIPDEPQANGLRQQQNQHGNTQMGGHAHAEDAPYFVDVSASQLIIQEPLRGRSHRAVQEREEDHHPADYIVNSEILYTQSVQYDTGGVKCHRHDQDHAEVQQQGILGYALVILRTRIHLNIQIFNIAVQFGLFCAVRKFSLYWK